MKLLSSDRCRVALCLAVILLLVLGGHLESVLHDYYTAIHPDAEREVRDFNVYYVAAQIAREHKNHYLYYPPLRPSLILIQRAPQNSAWDRLARADGFNGTNVFIYPPFAALVLQPLSYFSWPVSLLLWRIVLSAMVMSSIYLALRLAETDAVLLPFVLISAAVLSFFPFRETLSEGQINPIILLCWTGGLYLLKTNRPVWSALLFTIGTMVKVSPAIVVSVSLLRRQWRWLASYAGSSFVLLGISVWRLGWENHRLWFLRVLPALSQGVPSFPNKSIAALIYDLYLGRVPMDFDFDIPRILIQSVLLLNLAICAMTLFYFWRKNRTSTGIVYELIVLAVLSLIVSPVTWRHHYLLAILPLIFFWLTSRRGWRGWLLAAASTIATGLVLPDYVLVAVRNSVVNLVVNAIAPLTTVGLLLVLLSDYPSRPKTALLLSGLPMVTARGP